MERYENIVKIEEIRRLIEQNQYGKAVKILDTMDIGKIKTLTDLSIIADVYSHNERYQEAMEILLRIYSKTKTRRVLYQLVETSIKRRDAKEAEEYFEMYIKAAPQDFYRFIFRYCIDKLKKESYEILITSLEQLKEHEYIEMWAYELAKLYHKAGMKDKCVRECSDIILWFGEGLYVEKARLLKAYYVGEINPVHMLKAKDKREAEKRLGLDKTKDYSSIRSQIDQYLEKEEMAATASSILKQEEETADKDVKEWKPENSKEEWKLLTDVWSSNAEKKEEAEEETSEQEFHMQEQEQGCEEQEEEKNFTDEPNADDMPDNYTKAESLSDDYDEQEHQEEQGTHFKEELVYDNTKTEESSFYDEIEATKEEELEGCMEETEVSSHTAYSVLEEAGFEVEKELGYFYQMDFTRRQIKNCLETVLSDLANINHIVITGKKKSGKTILAKKICRGLHCLNWIKSNKIAIIDGEKFNFLDIHLKKDKLYNSSLVIENAGSLSLEGRKKLLDLLAEMKENILVILEDTEEAMLSLLNGDENLLDYFKNSINLPVYTDRDLTGFAIAFVKGKDYLFTGDVEEAFCEEVKNRVTIIEEENRLKAVMEFARETTVAADNRYKRLLTDIVTSRNLNSEDLLYIVKDDFISG